MARTPRRNPTPLEELGPRTGKESPHELIYRAYLLGWIHFGTKLAVLNRPGSPVYNAYENWGPVALLAFLSIYYGASSGWEAGLSIFVAGAFFGVLLLPRYVLKKLRMRVLEKAFGDEGGWRELWRNGGISIRLAMDSSVECEGPDGDWEKFARLYLDKPDES
ncbi:MAG TPA: hypothetical protein VGC25_02400 [Alphaproteobacteria bacterium]